MNKAALIAQRLDAVEDRFGPAARIESATKRTTRNLNPHLIHTIETPDDVVKAGNYMATYGNYPVGMAACDVIGLNGGCDETCPILTAGQCVNLTNDQRDDLGVAR